MNFLNKKSVEKIGVNPLAINQVKKYIGQLKNSWEIVEDKKITFTFRFKTFKEAISFVNKVADLAESENHHPNIHILYSRVKIVLSTHSVGGLSENDFIVAAKIEQLL